MKPMPLGGRLALWSLGIAAAGAAAAWAATQAVSRFSLPVSTSIVIAVAVICTVLVVSLKRANVINHHDQNRLALPPHVFVHLGVWALAAGIATGWAYHSIASKLPFESRHQLITAVVTLLVGVGTLLGEWWAWRERARFIPAWSKD